MSSDSWSTRPQLQHLPFRPVRPSAMRSIYIYIYVYIYIYIHIYKYIYIYIYMCV